MRLLVKMPQAKPRESCPPTKCCKTVSTHKHNIVSFIVKYWSDMTSRPCQPHGGIVSTLFSNLVFILGSERRCTPRQRNAQVRPWTVAAATCHLALAPCGDQVQYKLAVTVHRCLHNKAPKYLTDCCVAVLDIAGGQRLRSAHRLQLDVPCYRQTTLGRRAFSVAGPTVWNSLPVELRDEAENTFWQSLKTVFRQY